MILSCDIGNSSSSFGLFKENNDILSVFRAKTGDIKSVSKLKKILSDNLDLKNISGVSISSVVPSCDPIYSEFFSKRKIVPFFISSSIKLNIKIYIENPEKIGSDRIVNVCYAHFLNKKFQIVIDMGTALTIDIINENGCFTGGVIYPGIPMLFNFLYRLTEKLPLIDISFEDEYAKHTVEKTANISKSKVPLIGVNTESAVLSGIYNGNIFLIEGFIKSIVKYHNKNSRNVNIVFTGGNSNLFFKNIDTATYNKVIDDNFTLKGIKYLYDLNIDNI